MLPKLDAPDAAGYGSHMTSPAAGSGPEPLSGVVERVTFHNAESGFAVLRVKLKGRQVLATVVGKATSVTAGEHVEASGRWVIDQGFAPSSWRSGSS